MKEAKNNVIGGLAWSFAERIAAQLVSTVVGIILARLLNPEDYGLISIVMVFISFCNVFVTTGFGTAVVQKKEINIEDFNTAFILSFTISVLLYTALFLLAPYIAKLYQMPQLCAVLRVLGIRLIITAWNTIQQSYIQRQMQFRKFFIATIWGTVLSCIVGIIMAYSGYGVWALVAQYMVNSCMGTIVLHLVGGWKPRVQFSIRKAKEIFSFGWKVLCTQLVATLESDIRSLIVGKVFGPADLAYFDQGKKYPALLVNNVNASLNKVMLPAFSQKQDDLVTLKSMLRKSIRLGMFILAPIMIGLLSVADIFVSVVLTDKWLPIVPYLKVFCIIYLTRPYETLCHQTVISLGKSDTALRIMIAINVTALATVLLAVFVFENVFYMAIFSLLNAFVSVVCFGLATNKLTGYTFKEQLADLLPIVGVSMTMGAIVSLLKLTSVEGITLLILQIVTGGAVYVALSCIFKLESFSYILNIFRKRFFKRKCKDL